MKISFTKMEGAGNDFVFINALNQKISLSEELISKLCDRSFGVGADQLLVLEESEEADFRMDIYNADSGRVEMCGNGIRCLAKYVHDRGLSRKSKLIVETMGGLVYPEILKGHPRNTSDTLWVKVDMGTPVLEGRDIPVNMDGLVLNKPLAIKSESGSPLLVTCVSMGNPHCVIFVDKVEAVPVGNIGPLVEDQPFFPNRTNVEFVEIVGRGEVKMRVWERGAGETMACGSGACAAVVACILNGKTDREVMVHLNGGDLDIFWDEEDDHVWMTGPATTVFEGEMEIE